MGAEERKLPLAHSMVERRRYRRMYWRALARNAGALGAAFCGLVGALVVVRWALIAWLGTGAALPVAVIVSFGIGLGIYALDQRAKGTGRIDGWTELEVLGTYVADCNRWIRRFKRRQRTEVCAARRAARSPRLGPGGVHP
ncbi:MAG TPA: hypothetical protein VF188_15845 [Longimicrobiales bacterium]